MKTLKAEFGADLIEEASGRSVVRPKDLEAAARIVRLAGEQHLRVLPVGSGSKRDWADPPTPPVDKGEAGGVIELDMRGCNRLVDYSPEDMTVTVEAGMTLAGLVGILAEHNQRLTLDPPHAERATVGGVLAANDSGPVRLAYGTARDIVIGMSMIAADGERIHSGGRVVKNVAGYDLHKLYIGSFGTLGPIATVSFKLRPLPEARGLVQLQVADADAAEAAIAAALAGATRPTLIELLNAPMAQALGIVPPSSPSLIRGGQGGGFTLIIGFEENAEAVAWQCDQLQRELGARVLDAEESQRVYERLREAARGPAATSFKAAMLSSHVAGFMAAADRLSGAPSGTAATGGGRYQAVRMISHAGSGIVYGLIGESAGKDAGGPDAMLDEPAWRELAALAEAGRGYLHIRGTCPAGLPRHLGPERSTTHLCAAIRKAFDPAGLFAGTHPGL